MSGDLVRMEQKLDSIIREIGSLKKEIGERVTRVEETGHTHAREITSLRSRVQEVEKDVSNLKVTVARGEAVSIQLRQIHKDIESLKQSLNDNTRRTDKNSVFSGFIERGIIVAIGLAAGAIATKLMG